MTVCCTYFFVEIKEAADILSHVDNGKITISDLAHVLQCLNANLTEEDFQEALEQCDTSVIRFFVLFFFFWLKSVFIFPTPGKCKMYI